MRFLSLRTWNLWKSLKTFFISKIKDIMEVNQQEKNLEAVAYLWSDHSSEAIKLKDQLQEVGYTVKTILSGSSEPVISCGSMYVMGYARIRSLFDLR